MTRIDEWFKTLAVVFLATFIVLPSRANQPASSTAAPGASSQAPPPAKPTAPAPQEPAAANNCIIAVVPDPVDSDARWMFDPLVDAIYRALGYRRVNEGIWYA